MKPLAPEVSVVIPTYNRLGLLEQTVASVLSQTFADLELLVVDDGSNDGTLEYLGSINDPRLRIIALPHTGNVAAARNAGAAHARGRRLGFLDSDDIWLPEKLEIQVKRMVESGVRWCYTRYDHIDQNGAATPPRAGQWRELSGNIALEMILADASVALCTVLVDRSLFDDLGGFDEDPNLLRTDYHFMVRLSLTEPTVAVPESLASVRLHAGRTTGLLSGPAPFIAAAFPYDKLLPVLTDKRLRRAAYARRADHLAEAGSRYLQMRTLGAAARCFWRSALDQPNPRRLISAFVRGTRGPASESAPRAPTQ